MRPLSFATRETTRRRSSGDTAEQGTSDAFTARPAPARRRGHRHRPRAAAPAPRRGSTTTRNKTGRDRGQHADQMSYRSSRVGPDHRRGHHLGRRRNRERRTAAGRHGGTARRILRARLARRRERAGTRGSERIPRAARQGRRRAAPEARTQPARRRAAASRLAGADDPARPPAARDRTRRLLRPRSRAPRTSSTWRWRSCASSPAACTRLH